LLSGGRLICPAFFTVQLTGIIRSPSFIFVQIKNIIHGLSFSCKIQISLFPKKYERSGGNQMRNKVFWSFFCLFFLLTGFGSAGAQTLDCVGAIAVEDEVPYDGTTIGGSSSVSVYGCVDWDESGPEKVHAITTSIAGDITATISNLSENEDLDVFILSACDPLQCVGYGNETAKYANAPPGTYYIVVDGYEGASGLYTLTVDIPNEAFSCTEAVELEDKVPYSGSTAGASSLISLYSCSYWDESGPERVHVITTTGTGDIMATLTDLTVDVDLDVFILDACGPLSCVAAGDTEAVYEDAPPGTYYIVVDGYDGASGSYTLTVCEFSFLDVPTGFWAKEYIRALYCEGITSGYADVTYRPAQNVQRSQMAAFIIRAEFGEDFSYSPTPHFTDVPDDHWAFKYVQKMYDEGITTGYPDGTYRPSQNVTRGQMAAFIIKGLFGDTFSYTLAPYFTDVPDSHVFFKYIQKMYDEGITTGYTDGTYRPSQNVSRAQMATFIAKAFLGIP